MSNITVNIQHLFEKVHIHISGNDDVPAIKQAIEQAIKETLEENRGLQEPPLPETE